MPFTLDDNRKLDLLADLRRYWCNEGTTEQDATLTLRILLHFLLSRDSTDSDIKNLLE